jgi:hypothetical protein
LIRPIALLVSAILTSRPTMPTDEATRYAQALSEAAKRHDFDPLVGVAIIHFETHWIPSLVSADGEDHGLGQIRARYVGACRNDADPVGAPSEACLREKQALLDGVANIAHMGTIIERNRTFCRAKNAGKSTEASWLALYQGYGRDHGRWCVPGDKTKRVLAYRDELAAKLAPPKRPARGRATPKGELARTKQGAEPSSAAPGAKSRHEAPPRGTKPSVAKVAKVEPKPSKTGPARASKAPKAGPAKAAKPSAPKAASGGARKR